MQIKEKKASRATLHDDVTYVYDYVTYVYDDVR